jgi:hypothetical protein
MNLAHSCVLAYVLFAAAKAGAADPAPATFSAAWVHNDLAVASLDAAIPLAPRAKGAETVVWERTFVKRGTRYVGFQVDRIAIPADADMELQFVSDPAGPIVERYTAQQLNANKGVLVTGLLPPGQLRVRVLMRELRAPASMRLAAIQWQAESTALIPQAAVQKGDPIITLPDQDPLRRIGESIAMLHIGPLGSTCTAFVVDKDVIATNYHCMRFSLRFQLSDGQPVKECGDVVAEFDYVRPNEIGKTAPCTEVVKSSPDRDLVLLRVSLPATASGALRSALKVSADDPAASRLQILHYPMGRPLTYEDGCKFRGPDQGDYLHDCSTTPGSSGGVLLSDKRELVAVNYKGPYDLHLTQEQVDELFRIYGPLYNRAKPAALLSNIP